MVENLWLYYNLFLSLNWEIKRAWESFWWWWIWKCINLFCFILLPTGRLKYLTLTEANRVWMPDLFFSNEKEGHFHNIIMPNVYIRIFPYGSVLYSIRISLTLACPMNLKLYPLDRQICSLRMASCEYRLRIKLKFMWKLIKLFFSRLDGWTTADLVFLWKEGDPVQVVKNLHLPRFTLEKFLTDYCNSKTNTGKIMSIGIYKRINVVRI